MTTTAADHQLLRRYVESASAPAFEILVDRHLGHVFSAALRRVNGDHALAKDVAQTVFVDFARKASRIPGDMPPGGWLHRHTGFVASKMIDKERRRRAREQEAATMNATELDHRADPEWSATAPLLDAALDSLPSSDRDAIVLRFFEERDFRSVGEALGMSDDSAQKKVSRAIDKLRSALARRGVASTGGALATLLVANSGHSAPAGLSSQIATQSLAGAATAGGTLGGALSGLSTAARIKGAVALVALASAAGFAGSQLLPTGRPAESDVAPAAAHRDRRGRKRAGTCHRFPPGHSRDSEPRRHDEFGRASCGGGSGVARGNRDGAELCGGAQFSHPNRPRANARSTGDRARATSRPRATPAGEKPPRLLGRERSPCSDGMGIERGRRRAPSRSRRELDERLGRHQSRCGARTIVPNRALGSSRRSPSTSRRSPWFSAAWPPATRSMPSPVSPYCAIRRSPRRCTGSSTASTVMPSARRSCR